MARADRVGSRRTLAAFILTTVAVSVPTAAWFVSGMRELDREIRLEEKAVYHKAKNKALVLAERLATRFEMLRQGESRRPFYHYQNLYHDPRGAAHGPAITVSPLAEGFVDPLIEVHFQVDAGSQLTLPTVNDDFPELGSAAEQSQFCELRSDLAEIAVFCPLASTGPDRRFEIETALGGVGDLSPLLAPADPAHEVRTEFLTESSWRQHLQANALYADLKAGKAAPMPGDSPGPRSLSKHPGKVAVVTTPLSWHTVPVGTGDRPMALRSVDTPEGLWTQGFVIDRTVVEQYLASASYPAEFLSRDEKPLGEGEVRVPIGGTPWAVSLDISESLADTFGRVAAERERFFGFFLLGAAAAAFAGLLVVAMVYQSERLAQQRAQFAASAAHELRTPLAGLRLYGEMLAEGLGDPKRARRYARRMAGEAERLGRVVTNVLSFTRLERKSLALHPEPGELGPAIRDAVERQRPTLEENGAILEVEVPDGTPEVAFDRDALIHVVQNLLDNAEKYTRGVEGRRIRVELEPRGRQVALRVADNGPGVDPELQRRLFRPFSRGQHADASEGLGLGLVLVRALIRAQGGTIRYDDAEGGGAVFTVSFPRLPEPRAAVEAAPVTSS